MSLPPKQLKHLFGGNMHLWPRYRSANLEPWVWTDSSAPKTPRGDGVNLYVLTYSRTKQQIAMPIRQETISPQKSARALQSMWTKQWFQGHYDNKVNKCLRDIWPGCTTVATWDRWPSRDSKLAQLPERLLHQRESRECSLANCQGRVPTWPRFESTARGQWPPNHQTPMDSPMPWTQKQQLQTIGRIQKTMTDEQGVRTWTWTCQ